MQQLYSHAEFNCRPLVVLQSELEMLPAPFELAFLPRLEMTCGGKSSICPIICPHHMSRPWSFKLLDNIWNLFSWLKWPKRILVTVIKAACMLLVQSSSFHSSNLFCSFSTNSGLLNWFVEILFSAYDQIDCVYVWCFALCLTLVSVLESPSRLDEEHRLIARYAARLAAEAGNSTVSASQKDSKGFSQAVFQIS